MPARRPEPLRLPTGTRPADIHSFAHAPEGAALGEAGGDKEAGKPNGKEHIQTSTKKAFCDGRALQWVCCLQSLNELKFK